MELTDNDEDRDNITGRKFSTNRYCPNCETWMDWKKYYLDQKMCRECWKIELAKEKDYIPGKFVSHTKKKNENAWEEFKELLASK